LKHFTTPEFWDCYAQLPKTIQQLANQCFDLLKKDGRHPSLHLKKIKIYWAVRIGIKYRALAIESEGSLFWFWIGPHAEYDKILG
jgi:hypothetical protein